MRLWFLVLAAYIVVGTDVNNLERDVWRAMGMSNSTYYLVKGTFDPQRKTTGGIKGGERGNQGGAVTCAFLKVVNTDPSRHHMFLLTGYAANGTVYNSTVHGYALNANYSSGEEERVERHILWVSESEECNLTDPKNGDTYRLLYTDGSGCFILRPRESDSAVEKPQCEMWLEESKVGIVPQGCNDSYASQCPGTALSTYDKSCKVEIPYSSESTPPPFTSACEGTKQ